MITHLDPDATGTWDIRTLSGTRYRLEIPMDGRARVWRYPNRDGERGPVLRHDIQPVQLVAWGTYDQMLGLTDGISVGTCMCLVLEPLSPAGTATVRLTTPVLSIDRPAPHAPVRVR